MLRCSSEREVQVVADSCCDFEIAAAHDYLCGTVFILHALCKPHVMSVFKNQRVVPAYNSLGAGFKMKTENITGKEMLAR